MKATGDRFVLQLLETSMLNCRASIKLYNVYTFKFIECLHEVHSVEQTSFSITLSIKLWYRLWQPTYSITGDRHVNLRTIHSVDFIFHVIHATRDDIYQFVSITEYVHFILICDDKVVDSVCALSRSSRSYSAQLQMYFSCKTRHYLIALNESSMRINEQFCEFQLKQNTHAYFDDFFTRIDTHIRNCRNQDKWAMQFVIRKNNSSYPCLFFIHGSFDSFSMLSVVKACYCQAKQTACTHHEFWE